MPSAIALRALLGAGLGLGALDLLWINAALAPQLVAAERAPVAAAADPPIAEAPPAPAPAVAPPPPEVAPVVAPPVLGHVYFETGSAALDARAHQELAALVASASPAARIVLDGHADYRGTESLNATLSVDRAVAVQHALVGLGVDAARIRVEGAGEAPRSSALWRDRRVDIQILGGTP